MPAPTNTSSGTDAPPARRGARTPLNGRSGQAMTEAVIGLCLLSFTWMVTAYMLTMAENRVRCAAVGRHAAWQQAHNPNAFLNPATELTPFFIRHRRTVTPASDRSVRTVQARDATNFQGILDILEALDLRAMPVQRIEQRLNISNPDDTPLYRVDQREVPLMREVFSGVGRVGVATCEWMNMTDVLDNRIAVQTALSL